MRQVVFKTNKSQLKAEGSYHQNHLPLFLIHRLSRCSARLPASLSLGTKTDEKHEHWVFLSNLRVGCNCSSVNEHSVHK